MLSHACFPCSWYCHADDDVYFNAQSLSNELGKYDPYTEHVYLGQLQAISTSSTLNHLRV